MNEFRNTAPPTSTRNFLGTKKKVKTKEDYETEALSADIAVMDEKNGTTIRRRSSMLIKFPKSIDGRIPLHGKGIVMRRNKKVGIYNFSIPSTEMCIKT